ncbi:MAG: hypothetical protein Q9208_003840 [Pyrenodesmia sp. 3 TL-2023]
MARILLTGATGLVGGDVLYRLQQSSLSDSHISCLLRDPEKAQKLSESYPNVEIIQGNLDDSDLLEREASKADVVLNLAASDHVGAASAIAKGIQGRQDPGNVPYGTNFDLNLTEKGIGYRLGEPRCLPQKR